MLARVCRSFINRSKPEVTAVERDEFKSIDALRKVDLENALQLPVFTPACHQLIL